MKVITGLCLALLFPIISTAQWTIPPPAVDGSYAPADTVYMSPTGDDQASGTAAQPVRTFAKALSLLPFGVAGQQGGHAYGLIRLQPGYYRTNGWQQSLSQYQSGNTYKNVSIEGMGNVTIGGTRDSFANNHLIRLRGSHISIKNIRLQYTTGIGILVSSNDPINARQSHLLIQDVEVDSVGNFSILIRDTDTVLVERCTSLYAARPFSDTLTTPCQWPSGVKFYSCNQVAFTHGEIGFTRGEGLNFHNTQYGRGSYNKLHDNSSNVYCDNGSRIQLHNNLIYTTPGTDHLWRNCPADTGRPNPGIGILLANENACAVGGPVNASCRTNCPLVGLSYSHVDSIFIYNNFILNCSRALNLWEGVTGVLGGPNCITNVFFVHNTVAGYLGDTTQRHGLISVFFPAPYVPLLGYGYATASEIIIQNNIFSYPSATYPAVEPIKVVRDFTFPVPVELIVNHNRWNVDHARLGIDGEIDTTMPPLTPIEEMLVLKQWQPCPDQQNLVQTAPSFRFADTDYRMAKRGILQSNVGALEMGACNTTVTQNSGQSVHVYPNPVQQDQLWVKGITGPWQYRLYQLDGQLLQTGQGNGHGRIGLQGFSGLFLLQISSATGTTTKRVVVF